MRALLLLALLTGCSAGFHPLTDGGSDAGAANDLAAGPGGMGPGPLGALPTGYCCSAAAQCRSRVCAQLGNNGPYYCSDSCTDDTGCTGWSTQWTCDLQFKKCVPVNDPYTCVDGANFHYGGAQTGTCCTPGGARTGEGCLGGLCIAVGPNPGFCTQGCLTGTDCPSGYSCNAKQCWKTASIADPNTPYTCD